MSNLWEQCPKRNVLPPGRHTPHGHWHRLVEELRFESLCWTWGTLSHNSWEKTFLSYRGACQLEANSMYRRQMKWTHMNDIRAFHRATITWNAVRTPSSTNQWLSWWMGMTMRSHCVNYEYFPYHRHAIIYQGQCPSEPIFWSRTRKAQTSRFTAATPRPFDFLNSGHIYALIMHVDFIRRCFWHIFI